MKLWMNLYTFLIDHVDIKYCFGDCTYKEINAGRIKVNGKTPDSLNMDLKAGDIVTVNDFDYKVEEVQLI